MLLSKKTGPAGLFRVKRLQGRCFLCGALCGYTRWLMSDSRSPGSMSMTGISIIV